MKIDLYSIEQLLQLKFDIEKEIALREARGKGFEKEYELKGKALHPSSKKQFQFAHILAKETGSKIEASVSRVMLKMSTRQMCEAIELMKNGKRIRIY